MSPDKNILHKNENVFGETHRREFLKRALGLACVTTSASMLSSCSLKSADEFAQGKASKVNNGQLFNQNQMTALYAIADTILPRTDTPSASEVNCHNFVQHQLLQCHTKDEQQACIQIVEEIDQQSKDNLRKPFALITPEQQHALLTRLEQGQGFQHQSRAI
ncbi:gluconate 2-dehydrogenase subunit 3 family protein [Paraglaciecola aquimarina]|uniref:Gluconate 2-dehydrogenase subunit 3 family protein n=1 Tax=Paraglaciecola aquimarina TaxID=1235557 RepID=A0ABU3SUM3_9ALTE|nr:gluconate 2-dehydrogenase subunit 3 family protein [Paraglaciecola aquimarina]MDU0353714.1 gluconate 2-dehydrogenase subunit 3 family protein [Paraglaciecola aquimarina]